MNQIRIHIFSGLVFMCIFMFFCNKNGEEMSENLLSLSAETGKDLFFNAAGKKAMLLGKQEGKCDVWLSSLRVAKDISFRFFQTGTNEEIKVQTGELLLNPESAVLKFWGERISGTLTYFVPADRAGAIILLRAHYPVTVKIEASFDPALILMWPAEELINNSKLVQDKEKLIFTNEKNSFWSMAGCPASDRVFYKDRAVIRVLGDPGDIRNRALPFVFTGSFKSIEEAENEYDYMQKNAEKLLKGNEEYYKAFLDNTFSIQTPEPVLDEAVEWAKIAVDKGFVNNPELGEGLVAGYGLTGRDSRPGYSWFFGRDALWTIFALNGYGDYEKVKSSLELLRRNQREDGKIMHELPQSASFVDWEGKFPFYYHCADANPLYILAMNDYLKCSGDTAYLRTVWNSVLKAYRFSVSTDTDGNGFPENTNVGHGWVEGGPLYESIHEEIYLAGLWTAALKVMREMSENLFPGDLVQYKKYENQYLTCRKVLNEEFYDKGSGSFAFCRTKDGNYSFDNTVMPSVPAWFEVLDKDKLPATIQKFNSYDLSTDWGTRILSSGNEKYDPGSYHAGSVWPLFTGWVSTAEFKHGAVDQGLTHLMHNAMLTGDFYPGYIHELINGDNYTPPARSVQYQVWSSAMVLNPVILGLCGLQVNTLKNEVMFYPNIPFGWDKVIISKVKIEEKTVEFDYENDGSKIVLKSDFTPEKQWKLSLRLRLPPGAEFEKAELNNKKIKPNRVENDSFGCLVYFETGIYGPLQLDVSYSGGISVMIPFTRPEKDAGTTALKLIKTGLENNKYSITLEGLSGKEYLLNVHTLWEITSVDGAGLDYDGGFLKEILVSFTETGNKKYLRKTIILEVKK